MEFPDQLRKARIVPVMVIRDLAHAVPLARALVAGGLNILEITLRTPCALDAIKAIAAEVEGAVVGAGTVTDAKALGQACKAGARFIVSPGFIEELAIAARDNDVPLLPGIATSSDIMRGMAQGLSMFKFFPAESLGGAAALKALTGPFPQIQFCPTGGVSPKNLASYLAIPNVICAGGSWMIPADLGAPGAIELVTAQAREAVALAQA